MKHAELSRLVELAREKPDEAVWVQLARELSRRGYCQVCNDAFERLSENQTLSAHHNAFARAANSRVRDAIEVRDFEELKRLGEALRSRELALYKKKSEIGQVRQAALNLSSRLSWLRPPGPTWARKYRSRWWHFVGYSPAEGERESLCNRQFAPRETANDPPSGKSVCPYCMDRFGRLEARLQKVYGDAIAKELLNLEVGP